VEHEDFVVVVDFLRAPFGGQEFFERFVRGADGDLF
jgi:hypothetical protein